MTSLTTLTTVSALQPPAPHIPIVRKSFAKARVLLKSMNKWNDELCALYALPSPTQAQLVRINVVESALLEFDGYLRDGGKLPNSKYVKMANRSGETVTAKAGN